LISEHFPKIYREHSSFINPLEPNDPYSGRTAPLTSERCILYIYSTNIGTEYFKNGIYSLFLFSSNCSLFHNSNVFGSCIIHILYTGCAKIKKKIQFQRRKVKIGQELPVLYTKSDIDFWLYLSQFFLE